MGQGEFAAEQGAAVADRDGHRAGAAVLETLDDLGRGSGARDVRGGQPSLGPPQPTPHAPSGAWPSRGPASTGRHVRAQHPYAFKGLFTHRTCGRRMQGNWVRSEAYYRCRFPAEYAVANKIDHPLSATVREADIIDPLDRWLAGAFAPERIEHALTAMEQAQPQHHPETEALRRTIAEADRKLARHRAALEAGADPALVATWSREVQTRRLAAETRLKTIDSPTGPARRMTRQDIHDLVDAIGGLLTALRRADPADKAEVYRHLGLRLTYDHEKKEVLAASRPAPRVGVLVVSEGGLEPPRPNTGTSTSS